jgi:CheY-like chemotaxis protein
MTHRLAKVLIVDDDVDQLQILSAALEGKYEIWTASDGLEGYAIACREQPAVVVLDVMMPLVDGWTVLRKLRANPQTKDTRIVIATALDGDSVTIEASKLNVSRVLRKPIDLKELKDAIARMQP